MREACRAVLGDLPGQSPAGQGAGTGTQQAAPGKAPASPVLGATGSFHSSRWDEARCVGRSWGAALPRAKSKSTGSAEGKSFTFLSQAVYCPLTMVNFVKPFERLFGKRGSVRTRHSAISILFRREQVKPLFLIVHVTVCREYWCAASHTGLLKGLNKWTATE